jgi:hypothetical protein
MLRTKPCYQGKDIPMTAYPTKLLLIAILFSASGVAPAAAQFSGPMLPRLSFPDPAPTDSQGTVADCSAPQTCPTET